MGVGLLTENSKTTAYVGREAAVVWPGTRGNKERSEQQHERMDTIGTSQQKSCIPRAKKRVVRRASEKRGKAKSNISRHEMRGYYSKTMCGLRRRRSTTHDWLKEN